MSRPRYTQVPQETAEEEMYAAFDDDDDDEDDAVGEIHQKSQPLLGSRPRAADQTQHPLQSSSQDNLNSTSDSTTSHPPLTHHTSSRSVAGTYDFEYDYAMLPPPGSPPRPSQLALPNSYGNTNGFLPTSPPSSTVRTPGLLRRAFGAILPTHYTHDRRGGGLGNDGVFGNVVAKPVGPAPVHDAENVDGPYFVPEEAQKDAPPSYQAAQADAVPPYWENTILAPSGPLDGDMVIDNLPVGSVFAFLWNLLVSVSFQFVGFLLTYLLHTTHASKYGSRAGLGVTLIQYGFYMRSAEAQVPLADDGNSLWGWPDPNENGAAGTRTAARMMKQAIPIVARRVVRAVTVYNNGTASVPSNVGPLGPFSTSAEDKGHPSPTIPANPSSSNSFTPNDWLSFILMTMGWFLLITSFLGFWRVKRWERGVQRSVQVNVEREPSPEDLARNVQVLRNLEQAFGISWDAERRAGIGVTPAVAEPPQRTVGDGGLFGLHTALNASTPALEANNATGNATEPVEHTTRQGTRRLFRIQF